MLILASASPTRKRLLQDIGVSFDTVPSFVDENLIKENFGDLPTKDLALKLAQAKARHVSEKHPEAYVLGCDLIVDCKGKRFDKACSLEKAREQLQELRGKEHQIYSALSLFHQNQECWNDISIPKLTMWEYPDHFIEKYLTSEMPEILNFAGSYHIAGKGAHLFSEVQGDVFAIQGLQIFSLLNFLRDKTPLTIF